MDNAPQAPFRAYREHVPGQLLTLPEVADALATSKSQVYALVRRKELRAFKLGGRGQWRVDRRDLDAFVEQLYADTERAMGWDVGPAGLHIVLGSEIPDLVRSELRRDVHGFLSDHGLSRADIGWWVCHPGGPKVIDALASTLELDPDAVALTRRSLAEIGNLSSASVLHVLEDTLRERPPAPGSHGLLMAMGPGFCSELVLLQAAAA